MNLLSLIDIDLSKGVYEVRVKEKQVRWYRDTSEEWDKDKSAER